MSTKTGLAASLRQKKDIDLSTLQKNVNQLHSETKTISLQQPNVDNLQKFQVFLPKDIHKKIKAYCIEEELNLKDFSTEAIIEKAKKLDIL
jgi:hypothetical protein